MKENGLARKKGKKQVISLSDIMDSDYADYQALLVNTPVQTESLFYSLE